MAEPPSEAGAAQLTRAKHWAPAAVTWPGVPGAEAASPDGAPPRSCVATSASIVAPAPFSHEDPSLLREFFPDLAIYSLPPFLSCNRIPGTRYRACRSVWITNCGSRGLHGVAGVGPSPAKAWSIV